MSRRWNGSKSLQSKGYVRAQLKLGVCYGIGDGVAQDYVKAAKWFKKSADQGNEEAKVKLDELNRSRTSGCDYSRGAKKNEI